MNQIIAARDAGITEIVTKPISPASVFDKMYLSIATPRPFISLDVYTGPDRRRVRSTYHDVDRRSGGGKLTQAKIDTPRRGD
ncbi:MAG: hypothetical protein ACE5EM_01240 [Sphingomonadales bacterium]